MYGGETGIGRASSEAMRSDPPAKTAGKENESSPQGGASASESQDAKLDARN